MSMRVYKLEGGTGAKGAALGLLVVGAGIVLLVFGLALLVVLGVVGTAAGLGVLLYRRLTGRPLIGVPDVMATRRPDPSLEVFAEDAVVADRPIREIPDSLPPR